MRVSIKAKLGEVVFFSNEHNRPRRCIEAEDQTSAKNNALIAFKTIRTKTMCPFAKIANITDHMHWDKSATIKVNLEFLLASFIKFIEDCESSKLDAFLISAPASFGLYPAMLGEFLRVILSHLSEHDPTGLSCLNEDLYDPRWRYRFSSMKFFVTTFAPFYGESSSRTTHGGEYIFIMFQPKSSFMKLLPSSKEAKTTQHASIRDRFSSNGCYYDSNILECHKFVLPLKLGETPIEWWKPNNNFIFESSEKPTSESMCLIM